MVWLLLACVLGLAGKQWWRVNCPLRTSAGVLETPFKEAPITAPRHSTSGPVEDHD